MTTRNSGQMNCRLPRMLLSLMYRNKMEAGMSALRFTVAKEKTNMEAEISLQKKFGINFGAVMVG